MKYKIGNIIRYNGNNGAYGRIEKIGKKITVRKMVGSIPFLKPVTKVYFESLSAELNVIQDD